MSQDANIISMSEGPGSARDRFRASARPEKSLTETAGTPSPWETLTQSMGGGSAVRARAFSPGVSTPALWSSPTRVRWLRSEQIRVVIFKPSRAWLQRAWTVYMALPSAWKLMTGRSGQARAAPSSHLLKVFYQLHGLESWHFQNQ